MTKADIGWLAGFLDGEGSFMILVADRYGYRSWYCSVAASSTSTRLLDRCKELAGGYITSKFKPKGKAKMSQIWTLKGLPLDDLLPKLLPYLIEKREQAGILLALRRETQHGNRKGEHGVNTADSDTHRRREEMRMAVRALNHRGDTPIPHERVKALAKVRLRLRLD